MAQRRPLRRRRPSLRRRVRLPSPPRAWAEPLQRLAEGAAALAPTAGEVAGTLAGTAGVGAAATAGLAVGLAGGAAYGLARGTGWVLENTLFRPQHGSGDAAVPRAPDLLHGCAQNACLPCCCALLAAELHANIATSRLLPAAAHTLPQGRCQRLASAACQRTTHFQGCDTRKCSDEAQPTSNAKHPVPDSLRAAPPQSTQRSPQRRRQPPLLPPLPPGQKSNMFYKAALGSPRSRPVQECPGRHAAAVSPPANSASTTDCARS